MSSPECDSLVSVDWLSRHLDDPDLRILDASWHLPGSGRDAYAEFLAGHIPGAVFFDIDRIADPASDLPHMLPDAQRFAAEVGALGVDNDCRVVVYDSHGLFSAARAWWMLRAFGHRRVAVLDGGLPAWRARDLPLAEGAPRPRPAEFRARLEGGRVWSFEDVARNLDTAAAQLLDARAPGRFEGSAAEPRPGLRSGHIPGSLNLPFERVIDERTRKVLSPRRLTALFGDLDARPVVCTCGTGVSACVLAFALHLAGRGEAAVYDGSWTEWGGRSDTPVETGPASR